MKGQTAPLPSVGVYAYQLADLSLHKVTTDTQGRFLFQDLPAGLYKIIAHKPGFLPAVVPLTRATAQAYQFLELELAERAPGRINAAGDDFWAIRSRIPADVLRDIDRHEGEMHLASFAAPKSGQGLFHTEMQAMTGVEQTPSAGAGQVSDGRVGIEGRVGGVDLAVEGRFWQLSPGSFAPEGGGVGTGGGQSSVLTIGLEAGESSRIRLTSFNNRLDHRNGDGGETPVDLEHYQVSWSQDVGQNGRSDFAAQYTNESNYHRHGWIDPVNIPEASRTWRVEGAYTTSLGDSGTLQTGLRYREQQFGLGASAEEPAQSNIDLFGRGGTRIRPAVLVEYGLYSTLSDGSLSLAPQGGVVLQLGSNWQAKASASRRVYQDAPTALHFTPSLYEEGDLCEQGSDACYELHVSRKVGDEDDDNQISFGALHRTVGETLRLYFSDQFADRLESLYLVRGDELPEVQVSMSHKLSPQVLATLQSRVASGGGGTFVSSDRQTYENRVRYMVTSLDTQFQSTATGVFVAFHRLEQDLDPLNTPQHDAERLEFERLRLMLSQDLNILLDLAGDWVVQINMEVSRGTTLSPSSSDELRRRFLGGIAVKF
ncbi:MAG TPA: carboxypeptidase-like regulatory domain-containing protein [Thermoanaerobaculia bacterium]|nr:carboxypeptidase-like regulatory domain-containing protein [Thermoanaerobaculia bacterium]